MWNLEQYFFESAPVCNGSAPEAIKAYLAFPRPAGQEMFLCPSKDGAKDLSVQHCFNRWFKHYVGGDLKLELAGPELDEEEEEAEAGKKHKSLAGAIIA